jgi:hypothetical protein
MNAVGGGAVYVPDTGAAVGVAVPAGAGVGVRTGVGVGDGEAEVLETCAMVTAFSEVENDPVPATATVSPAYGFVPEYTVDDVG